MVLGKHLPGGAGASRRSAAVDVIHSSMDLASHKDLTIIMRRGCGPGIPETHRLFFTRRVIAVGRCRRVE